MTDRAGKKGVVIEIDLRLSLRRSYWRKGIKERRANHGTSEGRTFQEREQKVQMP